MPGSLSSPWPSPQGNRECSHALCRGLCVSTGHEEGHIRGSGVLLWLIQLQLVSFVSKL